MAREVRVAPHQIRRLEGVLAEDVIELVDKDTVLLNVIAASNMTGVITDLKTIVSEARKINPDIYVVTDAVQHAPHAAIDVKALQLDGINIAPYKFFWQQRYFLRICFRSCKNHCLIAGFWMTRKISGSLAASPRHIMQSLAKLLTI